MGLDITACSKLTPYTGPVDDDGEPQTEADCFHVYCNPGFVGRADGLETGYYLAAASTDFRAGSYSGYNIWRDHLARMAGYGSDENAWKQTGGPFWELIHFSDCEGVIGPQTSAKLAKDFQGWQERAEAYADSIGAEESSWFLEKYTAWREAFELASDDGAVLFH